MARTTIPGVHFFCDHRCWRCALNQRCAVFPKWRDAVTAEGQRTFQPAERVAVALAMSLEVAVEEMAAMSPMPACLPMPDAAAARDSVGAAKAFTAMVRERADAAEDDPLPVRATDYARASWNVLRAIKPVVSEGGDPAARDAVESLEETCATIASKIFRAVSGALAPEYDVHELQSDANGSAKVALLLIEEARQAWRVLMRPGFALADGAPARFVTMLDALEVALLRRFPRAFDFVRPGFDTSPPDAESLQLARAMLSAGAREGPAS